MSTAEIWSIASSCVTVIGFTVVIFTAIIALRQFKEMIKSRHMEGLINVYELMGNEQARIDRYHIYNKLKKDPEKISLDDWKCIQRVSTSFDKIGLLVKAGLVPKKELLESHYEVFIRSWIKLEPYIKNYRKQIGGRHVNHFEELANEAKNYHQENFPNVELKIIKVEKDFKGK
ncbi:hypothetical protein ACFLS4_05520 [Bacteroidota bacterium]